ncbi:hypothetical protein [Halobacillus sp. Marseille-P3879]|uniref:hypothetical protein n=1 Tax=Halobacillus TaxID=45667 RepID=UPI00135C0B2D|nr:hypothetical protein [Halobacillus sp. Marseille-P3879]
MTIFPLLNFIVFLAGIGFIVFIIVILFKVIELMKQRNDYLRDIRNELHQINSREGT